MEANVGEVTEIPDGGSDVGANPEVIGDGGVGSEGGRKRRRLAGGGGGDEVEILSANGDQIRGIGEVCDGGDVGRKTNAGVLERLEQDFIVGRFLRH